MALQEASPQHHKKTPPMFAEGKVSSRSGKGSSSRGNSSPSTRDRPLAGIHRGHGLPSAGPDNAQPDTNRTSSAPRPDPRPPKPPGPRTGTGEPAAPAPRRFPRGASRGPRRSLGRRRTRRYLPGGCKRAGNAAAASARCGRAGGGRRRGAPRRWPPCREGEAAAGGLVVAAGERVPAALTLRDPPSFHRPQARPAHLSPPRRRGGAPLPAR